MAIRKITLDYIHEMMSEFKLKNLKMCELGNQKIADDCVNFKIAKDYFKSLGIFHTSIDLNGEDGAIPLDFNKPINIGKFDVVTNIGFSEHIKDQEQCFNNIDNLANNIVINVVPRINNFINHKNCFKWYDEEFFYNLALKKQYEILDIGNINPIEKNKFNCVRCTYILTYK